MGTIVLSNAQEACAHIGNLANVRVILLQLLREPHLQHITSICGDMFGSQFWAPLLMRIQNQSLAVPTLMQRAQKTNRGSWNTCSTMPAAITLAR